MAKVKIFTDSNSGILQQEGKDMGVFVIPMPFTIDGEEYLEEISITQENFYKLLEVDASVTTSQPSRFYLQEIWEECLKKYDEIVYIPMSSGLSGTCATAINLAEEFNGRVQVVDNTRISVTQKESVYKAVKFANDGMGAKEIKSILEAEKDLTSIYITLGTLKYLKKGGRITAAAAALGSILRIKPILFSNGGNFEKCAMTINLGQAKKKMIQLVKQDLEGKFLQKYNAGQMSLSIAHTENENEANRFKEELEKEFPNLKVKYNDPLSLSVSCHIGPGALAVAVHPNY